MALQQRWIYAMLLVKGQMMRQTSSIDDKVGQEELYVRDYLSYE